MEDDPESSNDSVQCAETNYVMIPCDINIARMLGWPIHMLQRVSQPMLERYQNLWLSLHPTALRMAKTPEFWPFSVQQG